MWRWWSAFFVVAFLWLSQPALAFVEKTIDNLAEVPDFVESVLIKQKHIPPKAILVVFDDDNTLLTTPKHCPTPQAITCQYLGGHAWYAWQHQLLKHHPDSPQLVANTQKKLDRVQSFLFDFMPLKPTQPDVPELISRLNTLGTSLLIETARGPSEAGATWEQLQYNKLSFRRYSLGSLLSSYSLEAKSCGLSGWGSQPVAVRNGILYTSGRNKGRVLACLLKKRHDEKRYQAVVMVDDDKKNLDHVRDNLAGHYELHLFEYTKMHSAVAAFLEGPKRKAYQAQASKLWERLRKMMISTFPALMV